MAAKNPHLAEIVKVHTCNIQDTGAKAVLTWTKDKEHANPKAQRVVVELITAEGLNLGVIGSKRTPLVAADVAFEAFEWHLSDERRTLGAVINALQAAQQEIEEEADKELERRYPMA